MFDQQELFAGYQPLADPWVRFNFVSSLDGAATVGGLSGGLNDPWDLQVFHTLRALAHVVVVGAGTIRVEGYDGVYLPEHYVAWRKHHGLPDHPRLVIISGGARLEPSHEVFNVGARKDPPIVFVGAMADPHRVAALEEVATVVSLPGEGAGVDVRGVVGHLSGMGYTQILSEGGPHLLGAFTKARMVDELCLTLSPWLVGGPSPRIAINETETPTPMGLINAKQGGAMVFFRYGRTLGPEASAPKEL